MALPSRSRVLSLYKRILQTGKNWEGTAEDAQYIQKEAKKLFRRNSNLNDQKQIEEKIFEAETRLELGLHYKIPYPRPSNVGPETTTDTVKRKRVLPRYMDSYKDEENLV